MNLKKGYAEYALISTQLLLFIQTFFSLISRELTDLVKSLKEQLQLLRDQNRNLKGKVEEEVQARKRLENILKNNVLPNRNDIEWNDD